MRGGNAASEEKEGGDIFESGDRHHPLFTFFAALAR